VNKAFEAIQKSAIIIYLFDSHEISSGDLKNEIEKLSGHIGTSQLLIVANKIDVENIDDLKKEFSEFPDTIFISAKEHKNIDQLKQKLLQLFDTRTIDATDTIVTNARHANSLRNAENALRKVREALDSKMPGDILALDIRYALDELGMITGQVTNEDLLDSIFTRFCIGK
jgi:tRNA modification GTPase